MFQNAKLWHSVTLFPFFYWSAGNLHWSKMVKDPWGGVVFTCRNTSFECCWLDGIVPAESNLLLLRVVLLHRLIFPCFSPPSFDYGLCLLCLIQKRCLGLFSVWPLYCHILSYFYLFIEMYACVFCQTGTFDWMVVIAADSWWPGSVMLSCILLLHCTAVCHFLLTVISNQWIIVSWYLVFE